MFLVFSYIAIKLRLAVLLKKVVLNSTGRTGRGQDALLQRFGSPTLHRRIHPARRPRPVLRVLCQYERFSAAVGAGLHHAEESGTRHDRGVVRYRRQHRQPAHLSRSATMLQPAAPCLISEPT